MNKLQHYKVLILVAVISLTFSACKKDSPTPEIPEEEIGKAELILVEVEREAHGDHYHYNEIVDATPLTIAFDAKGLPPVGTHVHLEEGKTYKVSLKSFDFAGREMHQEFIEKHDTHQAFFLGAPTGTLTYVYADRDKDNKKVNVGVTGYLTVDTHADQGFIFRYVLRHLNPGVKANITAANWNDLDFASKFAGANDLDLKFEVHLVDDGGHDH
jgi:hypothetical protein